LSPEGIVGALGVTAGAWFEWGLAGLSLVFVVIVVLTTRTKDS
jgi:hypothetical protein